MLKRVIAWGAVFSASAALVKAAYMGLALFLAAVLPPTAYAGFGLLYAAQTAMGAFAGVGVQETTIGRLKEYMGEQHRNGLFTDAVKLFYVTAVLALMSAGVVLMVVEKSAAVTAVAILAALLLGIITAFAAMQAALIRLKEQHAASLAYSAGVPLVACVGSAIGIWLAGTLESVFVGGLVAGLIGIGVLAAVRHGYAGAWPRWQGLRRDLLLLAPFAVMAFLGWLSGYGIIFVINDAFESVYVAHYTFLFMVSSVSQMVATSMNMVWSPRFYRLFIDGSFEGAERQNQKFFLIQAVCLGGIGAISVAALPWFANGIGGHLEAYGDMRLELALLFAGYVAAVPWWHTQNYYFVANQGARLMRVVMWMGAVGLSVWIVCMLAVGPLGIYVGFAAQAAVKSLGVWADARRQWLVSPPWAAIVLAMVLVFVGMTVPRPDGID